MGKKVNFNSKNNKKNTNKLKIIGIVLIAILIVYILVQSLIKTYKNLPKNNTETKKLYYDVNKYSSLADVLSGYEAKLIQTDDSEDILKIYISFSRNLYTNEKSNKAYFYGLINVVAEYEKYKNFELIDNSRQIDIEIKCLNSKISEIKINRRY